MENNWDNVQAQGGGGWDTSDPSIVSSSWNDIINLKHSNKSPLIFWLHGYNGLFVILMNMT